MVVASSFSLDNSVPDPALRQCLISSARGTVVRCCWITGVGAGASSAWRSDRSQQV